MYSLSFEIYHHLNLDLEYSESLLRHGMYMSWALLPRQLQCGSLFANKLRNNKRMADVIPALSAVLPFSGSLRHLTTLKLSRAVSRLAWPKPYSINTLLNSIYEVRLKTSYALQLSDQAYKMWVKLKI